MKGIEVREWSAYGAPVLSVERFNKKMILQDLKKKVLDGKDISKEEALFLAEQELEELCRAADEIRERFFEWDFDFCGVISAKGGRCSENCRYCAQSTCASVPVKGHPMVSPKVLLQDAKLLDGKGVRHYCIVTSGRRVSDREIALISEGIRQVCSETGLQVCTSMGLLGKEQFLKLKEAGVVRIHNNLETSRRYFPSLCTSHTYEEKIETIRAARSAGLEVCSGGIIGVGETMEDRIDMALELRKLDVQSVPINMLDPVPGTPLGDMPVLSLEEVRRTIALFRFLLPRQYIRLAAGRDYLSDSGFSCFRSGSNAAITGDMLTVKGISVAEDIAAIRRMGYQVGS